MYFGKNTPKDQSTAYGPRDLGLGRALPLSKLIADYQGHAGTSIDWVPDFPGVGTVSEAHVFIEDPQQTWDDLFKINMNYNPFFNVPYTENPSRVFSRIVSGRAGGIGIVWPKWHGLSAPGDSRSSVNLKCPEFYPSVEADIGTRVGCTVHHVQALRVDDRGGCAAKTDMPAREFGQSLWCGFNLAATGDYSNAVRHANKVASALTHEPGTRATNALGGFAGYIDFEVDFYSGNFGHEHIGTQRWYMVYGYRFTLDNGILALGPLRWNAHVMNSGAVLKDAYSTLLSAMKGTGKDDARTQFKHAAQLAQAQPIPDVTKQYVECKPSSDPATLLAECDKPIRALDTGLGFALGHGLITSDERNYLRDHVLKDGSNWTCQAHELGYYDPHNCVGEYAEEPPKPVCRLQLRAQRLNVYPDSVELVWFNGDQRPMTAAFALAKAVQGLALSNIGTPEDFDLLHQLCTPSPVGPGEVGAGPPDYYQESYIYDPAL